MNWRTIGAEVKEKGIYRAYREYRQEQLRLTTLETRRKKGDLIQFIKLFMSERHKRQSFETVYPGSRILAILGPVYGSP
jgi:hypothetical protein